MHTPYDRGVHVWSTSLDEHTPLSSTVDGEHGERGASGWGSRYVSALWASGVRAASGNSTPTHEAQIEEAKTNEALGSQQVRQCGSRTAWAPRESDDRVFDNAHIGDLTFGHAA